MRATITIVAPQQRDPFRFPSPLNLGVTMRAIPAAISALALLTPSLLAKTC